MEVSGHVIVSPFYTGGSGNWKYGCFIGIDMLVLLRPCAETEEKLHN